MESTECFCGRPRRPGQRNCLACHAKWMRDNRKNNPPTAEQRRKIAARSYLAVYVRRGKVQRKPCEVCGAVKAQAHHPDYSKPLEVQWLCRRHHLALHRAIDSVQGCPLP